MLGFIEQLTNAPERTGPHDIAALRDLGVSDRAILDATYICMGFNIINRIADAMDFEVPQTQVFVKGAWFMRRFGYRLMSGSFAKTRARLNEDATSIDPYASMLGRMRDSVLSGPGTLDVSVRQAIGAGDKPGGALGLYVSKVAQRDYHGVDKCIADLRCEGYSDNQIFEATICAAFGAGVQRLRLVLNAVVLCSHPAPLEFRRAS
jgi:alkylhydroperoxidase family enzyme